jgi:hypothetical protein
MEVHLGQEGQRCSWWDLFTALLGNRAAGPRLSEVTSTGVRYISGFAFAPSQPPLDSFKYFEIRFWNRKDRQQPPCQFSARCDSN